jgi:hypothetical protein
MLKRRFTAVVLSTMVLTLVALLASGVSTQAKDPEKKMATGKMEGAATQMSEYLVISPHTVAECMTAMDEVAGLGKDVLAKYEWGCMSGDHTAYIKVQAKNESEALKTVPASIRSKARAIKMTKFTLEEIQKFHQSH